MKTYNSPSQRVMDQIENAFEYHSPIACQGERYVQIRKAAKALAVLAVSLSPESREQSMALTDLENFVMHLNAAIARNEKPSDF